MNRAKSFVVFLAVMLAAVLAAGAGPSGRLFIIGGGQRPAEMMREFIRMAEAHGGGRIVVLPMASSVPEEVGPVQAARLRELGARDVVHRILTREQAEDPRSLRLLEGVGGVFFSGGAQSRLLKVIFETPFHNKLKDIYQHGAVIGGTSAGAAVLSAIMITGGEKREVEAGTKFSTIEPCNVLTLPGLAFIRGAIIDQHFIRRKRHNRLISLVVENPRLLGIGIDESTAVAVEPDRSFVVLGQGNVIVYDAVDAEIADPSRAPMSCHGMVMHLLRPGDRFDLTTRKVLR